jgi:ribosomal protein S18 acetylase RimI-like enzyme
MSNFVIEPEPADSTELAKELAAALTRHNTDAAGHHVTIPVGFRIRAEDGSLLAGIAGYIWARWLYISSLWVHPAKRGRGIGLSLLQQAERFALKNGCRDAYLTTFDFQAPGLYRRHGYQIFGQLPDYPAGHTYFFLHKSLLPDALSDETQLAVSTP